MPKAYTSNELLSSLRNMGMLPSTGSTGSTDTDALVVISEALRSRIMPEVMSVREEYFVRSTRTTLVSGTSRYRIPSRAAGNKISRIFYTEANSLWELTALDPDEIWRYDQIQAASPEHFFLEGNHIVLLPVPTTGSLQISFFFRPGELVLTSAARQVTAVDLGTRTVTLASAIPTGWTTANLFDVHSKVSGAEIKVWDAAATTVAGTSIVFSAAIDGSTFGTYAIEVGDWVCLAEEAVIPALPQEAHPMLVRAAALQYSEALGDLDGFKIHAEQYKLDLQNLKRLLAPRVEGKARFVSQLGGAYLQSR